MVSYSIVFCVFATIMFLYLSIVLWFLFVSSKSVLNTRSKFFAKFGLVFLFVMIYGWLIVLIVFMGRDYNYVFFGAVFALVFTLISVLMEVIFVHANMYNNAVNSITAFFLMLLLIFGNFVVINNYRASKNLNISDEIFLYPKVKNKLSGEYLYGMTAYHSLKNVTLFIFSNYDNVGSLLKNAHFESYKKDDKEFKSIYGEVVGNELNTTLSAQVNVVGSDFESYRICALIFKFSDYMLAIVSVVVLNQLLVKSVFNKNQTDSKLEHKGTHRHHFTNF